MSGELDDLLRQVRKRGLRLNNCFQRQDGFYQVNLRSDDSHAFYEFGSGPDAAMAVERALEKVAAGKTVPGVASVVDQPAAEIPAGSDEDLIG